MSNTRCARCGHPEAYHPEGVTPAQALVIPDGQPCHRYEQPAPLLLRWLNR